MKRSRGATRPPAPSPVFASGAARPAALAAAALFLAALAGCAGRQGPPPIRAGMACANCTMEVQDLGFACERAVAGRWRVYESIECLLRDARAQAGESPYLPDYDSKTLHPVDSLWVVRGNIPSPMGGGYAAFLERTAADEVASRTAGTVARYADFLGPRKDGAP